MVSQNNLICTYSPYTELRLTENHEEFLNTHRYADFMMQEPIGFEGKKPVPSKCVVHTRLHIELKEVNHNNKTNLNPGLE